MVLSLSNGTTTLTLPENLLWVDELDWDAHLQAVTWALNGAAWVEDSPPRTGGRPITYQGGLQWAPLTRTALLALLALGTGGLPLTLTHHDARTFRCLPRRESGAPWVKASPWPVVADSGPANPSGTALYAIEELRLIEVPL